jgi:hypothetical protein
MSLTLLTPFFPAVKGIRLLGVSISSFDHDKPDSVEQMRLSL